MVAALRILCFGDSLTSGYQFSSIGNFPYGDTMQVKLAQLMNRSAADIVTVVNGIPGAKVLDNFLPRMQRQLRSSPAFDWVVVLGGTNDLGSSVSADTIYGALESIWDAALEHNTNTKVLALTIPECAYYEHGFVQQKEALNEKILARQMARFHAWDLYPKMPYKTATQEERDTIWDDGLHFSPAGYARMGGFIAEQLYSLITEYEEHTSHNKSVLHNEL